MPLSGYRVADFIYEDVDTIAPDAPLRSILQDISGTKYDCYIVVDQQRRPIGIVTSSDLIRRLLAEEALGGEYLRAVLSSSTAALQYVRDAERARGRSVADAMTAPVVVLDADDTLQHAAQILGTRRFKRIPIVRDGVLIGILRAVDLIGPALDVLDAAEE